MRDISKWREPLFRDFLKNDSNNQKKFIQYIFKRYKDFETKLYTIFENPNKNRTIGYKLTKLRQIRFISIYTIQFR